jgi:ribonuclease I
MFLLSTILISSYFLQACNSNINSSLLLKENKKCKFPNSDCYQLRLQKVEGCTNGDYTIHGLWPQRKNNCKHHRGISKSCKPLQKELDKHWYTCKSYQGWTNEKFRLHEWNKHGSCSDMTQKEYFEKTLQLYKKHKYLCKQENDKGPKLFRKTHSHNKGAEECGICFDKNLENVIDCH